MKVGVFLTNICDNKTRVFDFKVVLIIQELYGNSAKSPEVIVS
tara:strand:- start:558 stop:686 length:129 start_codon:yes stop_codon:yes gene_type:complete